MLDFVLPTLHFSIAKASSQILSAQASIANSKFTRALVAWTRTPRACQRFTAPQNELPKLRTSQDLIVCSDGESESKTLKA